MALNRSSAIINEVKKAVIGNDDCILRVYLSLLAGGNVLLESQTGCGKSTMVKAFSKVLSLDSASVRFSSDMLTSDLVGMNVFNKQTSSFEYKKGVISSNLFHADDINKASERINALLLDTMDSGVVTVEGTKHQLPNPFSVLASYNESYGQLSEALLDRFMMKFKLDYPSPADEKAILLSHAAVEPVQILKQVVTKKEFLEMKTNVKDVYTADAVLEYVSKLISATRKNKNIVKGASTRVSMDLVDISKSAAWVVGRDYVMPGDITALFVDVVAHRVVFANGADPKTVLTNVMNSVVPPNMTRNRR